MSTAPALIGTSPSCQSNLGSLAALTVIQAGRIIDFPYPGCFNGGPVSGNITLASGLATRYKFDTDTVNWAQEEITGPHGSYYRHTITADRTRLEPAIMAELSRLRNGHFVLVAEDFNGYSWIIGSPKTPALFSSRARTGAERVARSSTSFRWEGKTLGPAYTWDGIFVPIGCSLISTDDFTPAPPLFDQSTGEFLGMLFGLDPFGIVASVSSYPVAQITGPGYTVTPLEMSFSSFLGWYAPSGQQAQGAITLSPGTYTFTVPPAPVILKDGSPCTLPQITQTFTIQGSADGDFLDTDFNTSDFN